MRLIRLKEVMNLTGLGRSSIYKLMKEGQFPLSISLGERAVAWQDCDINEWVQSKINSSNDSEMELDKSNREVSEEDVIAFIVERFKGEKLSNVLSWILEIVQ